MIGTETLQVITVDWSLLADQLDELVIAKMHSDLDQWKNAPGMRAIFVGHARDGLEVCKHVRAGDTSKVRARLWQMDTAAREYVYEMLERLVGGPDILEKMLG